MDTCVFYILIVLKEVFLSVLRDFQSHATCCFSGTVETVWRSCRQWIQSQLGTDEPNGCWPCDFYLATTDRGEIKLSDL